MIPSTDLFLLIHSMTKPEKGYFKKFREGHKTDGNYIKLFDAINAQKVYNEAALKKKFEKESFINQFPFYKNYLYNLILKSLVVFHAENTSNARIAELMRRTEILIDKGMVVQAGKSLKEAKELAIKYEKYSMLQDILPLEVHIHYRTEPWSKGSIEKIDCIYKEQKEALERTRLIVDNLYTCNYLYNRFFIREDIPKAYRVSDKKAEQMLLEMNKDNKFKSFDSQRIFYYTGATFYGSIDHGGAQSLAYLKKTVNHFNAYPHQLKERIRNYADQLYSYMQNALFVGNIKDYKDGRTKLMELWKNLPSASNTEFNKLKIPVSILHSDLYYYYRTCQFERVTEVISELKKNNIFERIGEMSIPVYGSFFYMSRLQILYNIGCLFFYSKDYARALQWLSMLWNDKKDKALYVEVYHSIVVSIICHYEMGKMDSMKYLMSGITKSVKVEGRYKKIGEVFCPAMLQLAKCNTEAEKVQVFERMKKGLTQYQGLLEEFTTFNLLLWIESKLKKKPAALVLKEYMKNRDS